MTQQEAIESADTVLNSEVHYNESLKYQLATDDIEWLKAIEDWYTRDVGRIE